MSSTCAAELAAILERDLRGLQREVELFDVDGLLWVARPGVANPVGNLALHIAGNIRHFIGHNLGGFPYIRDRDDEFGRRSGTRAELIAALGEAVDVLRQVVPQLSDEQLDRPFPGASTPVPVTTRRFLIHLATHAAFHLGQAGYLRRIVTGDARSTDTVSAARLT